MVKIIGINGIPNSNISNNNASVNSESESCAFTANNGSSVGDNYSTPFKDENRKILENMGIREYHFTPMTTSNAVELSQNHLIDLIRYYEGKKEGGKYIGSVVEKDKFNIETYGFGLRKLAMYSIGKAKKENGKYIVTDPPKNQTEAFDQLIQYTDIVIKKEVQNYLGKELYNKLPQSVKEAVLDYHFKNGYQILAKSGLKQALSNAVQNNNWAIVLDELVFAKPASQPNGKDEPGIYRRSLSRVILAAKGLKSLPGVNGVNGVKIDEAVKKIYQNASACAKANKISTKDFDNIYNVYTGKAKNPPTIQNDNPQVTAYKCLKKEESLYSLSIALRPQGQSKEFTIKLIQELAKLNDIELKGTDKNGYPCPTKMISENELVKIPKQITFNGQTFQLNTLSAGWEKTEDNSNSTPHPKDNDKSYTVKSGQGYYSIAKDLIQNYGYANYAEQISSENSTIEQQTKALSKIIFEMNNNKSLKPGDTIKIPNLNNEENIEEEEEEYIAPTLFQEAIINNTAKIDEKSLKNLNLCIVEYDYEIQPKEGLYSIAGKLGVDIKTLQKDNKIKNIDKIQAGQNLKIKSIGYKVKSGDNLAQIAKKFNTSIDMLTSINMLENKNKINEGQIIQIPAFLHTVQKNESLTKIAQKAGVSVDDIRSINKISSNNIIKENSILVIPYQNANFGIEEKVIQDSEDKDIEVIELTDKSIPKLLQTKRKKNGKILATRKVFEATKEGKLSGKTIIVNAGHGYHSEPRGATDIGTPGKGGLADEWLINYHNAMRLKDKLTALGATVIFIQGREGRSSKGQDLISAEIRKEKNNADMFISLHVNSSEKAPAKDKAEVFYPTKSSQGKQFAEIFEKKLDDKQNDEEYAISKSRGYQVLTTAKNAGLPAMLYEVAFMNHKDGRARMKNDKFIDANITLLAESTVEYFSKLNESQYTIHTVAKGDTLTNIATKYGVTVKAIKELNNLTSDTIYPKQKLKIPKKSK